MYSSLQQNDTGSCAEPLYWTAVTNQQVVRYFDWMDRAANQPVHEKSKLPGLVWRNWNNSTHNKIDGIFYPKTPQEISEIVKKYPKIKVFGAGHAKNIQQAEPGSVAISMKYFDHIESVTENSIVVEAAVTLRKVCEILKPLGKQMVTVLESGMMEVGALACSQANDTNSQRATQWSSWVVKYWFVDGNGDMRVVDTSDDDIRFMRNSLGHFGIVYKIEIQTIDTEMWKSSFGVVSPETFFENRYKHGQVFGQIFPMQPHMMINYRNYESPLVRESSVFPGDSLFQDYFVRWVYAVSHGLACYPQAKITRRMWDAFQVYSSSALSIPVYINPNDRASIWGQETFLDFEEWAFPEDQWLSMVKAYQRLVYDFDQKHNWSHNLPAFVYVLIPDEKSILSRANDGTRIVLDPNDSRIDDPLWWKFRQEYRKLAVAHGGKPHISKCHYLSKYDISNYSKDNITSYVNKQKEYDPTGKFITPVYKRLFLDDAKSHD